MKIGDSADVHVAISSTAAHKADGGDRARAASKPQDAAPGAGASAGAAVTISSQARSMIGQSGAEIDMEKVNQVRAEIQSGRFKANPEVIADKLLANAQEMMHTVRH